MELKITALDYTAVLSGVADGKYDFAISAIAYAPSRAEAMRLSARGYTRILRTARSIADLEGSDAVRRVHVAEALSYRRRPPVN